MPIKTLFKGNLEQLHFTQTSHQTPNLQPGANQSHRTWGPKQMSAVSLNQNFHRFQFMPLLKHKPISWSE